MEYQYEIKYTVEKGIVWNYIDNYWNNIGCSAFYCIWKWYRGYNFRYYCSYIGISNISGNLYDIKRNQKL